MGANASFPEKLSPSQRPASLGRINQVHLTPEGDRVILREKKKKSSKFATLRRKLIRVKRHSRSFDHAKCMRELTSSWTIRELSALVEEYEASIALKELAIQAGLSRPHANSIKEDLSLLYDYKYCTDIDLLYRGVCFPVHRAILSIRCPFFRDLLGGYPEYGIQVPVTIRTPGVDVNMFSALLRYLYTGEFKAEETTKLDDWDLLMQLAEEFGNPNPLERDLKVLLDTGLYSDAVLIFASESEAHEPMTPEGVGDSARLNKPHELRCHKAILAARSPFFRNVLMRRARSGEEMTERALQSPTCIVLDECVIPRRYARVLLNAVYMDTVDLSCIVRSSVSMCSLSEVQAMVAGKVHMSVTDEAMEIYQIGEFLDFPILSQGCEDMMGESLALDNLVSLLAWSCEPHGSQWLHRQALHFLHEEFLQVAHSAILYELSRDYMVSLVQSDFLQAGELDILSTVLKWGEHQLIKRIEDREPNLLTHTAHSITKKGIKKRDLNDIELRDILADLLPHVRTDHIIPPNNDVLNSAIKRGLISVPPSHMIVDESCHTKASAWVRGKNNGMFIKPRLFLPFYEEAKALLEEQTSQVQENEVVRLRMVHMSAAIPDTLYMVEDKGCAPARCSVHLPSSSSTVDIIAGTIPVPDQDTFKAMLQRERELQQSPLVQRAHCLSCSHHWAVNQQVQLRVVREFGLPDSAVEILQQSSQQQQQQQQQHHYHHHLHHQHPEAGPLPMPSMHAPGRARHAPGRLAGRGCQQQQRHQHHRPHRHVMEQRMYPSMPSSPARPYTPVHLVERESGGACGSSSGDSGLLSGMMPDIAMATASLSQLNLQDRDLPHPQQQQQQQQHDLELDLGDGNNHSGTGTLYI